MQELSASNVHTIRIDVAWRRWCIIPAEPEPGGSSKSSGTIPDHFTTSDLSKGTPSASKANRVDPTRSFCTSSSLSSPYDSYLPSKTAGVGLVHDCGGEIALLGGDVKN